ncbi:MAG TPA: AzlD domain-containing protein [Chthoniobacterales bacterium]|nr:AzlD domain-containing protein [Chthoniobacterales bacterium]
MKETFMVFGLAVLTYLTRFLVIPWKWGETSHLLPIVTCSIFSAIIVPTLLYRGGALDVSATNEYLCAGIAAIVFSAVTRNLWSTIAFGFVTFYAWRFLRHFMV